MTTFRKKFGKMHKFWSLHLGIFDEGLVSKFLPDLSHEGYGLDFITVYQSVNQFPCSAFRQSWIRRQIT